MERSLTVVPLQKRMHRRNAMITESCKISDGT